MMNQFENDQEQGFTTYTEQEKTNSKKKKGDKLKKGVAYALIFGVIAGSTFTGLNYFMGKNSGDKSVSSSLANTLAPTSNTDSTENKTQILNTSSTTTANINDVSSVVTEVMPSIVSIACTSQLQGGYSYYGQGASTQATSAGTGIIVSQDKTYLYVATNNHVVDGANKVQLTFSDGSNVNAEVKGTASSSDLAVVQCKLADLSA